MIHQRTLLKPGEGIIPPEQPGAQHQEYPKHMRHPGFQPGVADKEIKVINPETGRPTGQLIYTGSKAIRFPDVMVNDRAQEEGHAAQGYYSLGKSDPAAFAKAVASAAPPVLDYKPIEYPKWVGGVLCNSPEDEAAAEEKRRVQAGGAPANTAPAQFVEPSPTIEAAKQQLAEAASAGPEKTAEQQRIEYLEAQMEEMRLNMRVLMAGKATGSEAPAAAAEVNTLEVWPPMPVAAPAPVSEAEPPPEMTKSEKMKAAWVKRRANAAGAVFAAEVNGEMGERGE